MGRPRNNLRRYHYNVYFPESVGPMCLNFLSAFEYVDVTHHAAEQLLEDRRGIMPLPSKPELFHPDNTLVEFYELLDSNNQPTGVIQKALIRIHNMSEQYDYSYIIAREGFIVSAWANDKGDNHRLTSENDYYKPR